MIMGNVSTRHKYTGLFASFLKGQGHQYSFFLANGTLEGKCQFLLEHLKCIKAMTRGHRAIAFVASVINQARVVFPTEHPQP